MNSTNRLSPTRSIIPTLIAAPAGFLVAIAVVRAVLYNLG